MMEALISAGLASIVSIIVATISARATIANAQQQFKLEDAAETVANALLSDPRFQWRTFAIISHHLGGFEENELRRILVRAGAIRITSADGEEMWGLLSRNRDYAGVERISAVPVRTFDPDRVQQQQ